MDNNTINNLFADIAKYRMIKAETEAELERLEKTIKNYMQEAELDELIGNEHKASYKAVTSTRLDSKALKAGNPAIYEQYSKQSQSMRFTFN